MTQRDEMTDGFDSSDVLTQAPPSTTRWTAMVDCEGFLSQASSSNNDAARFLAGMVSN